MLLYVRFIAKHNRVRVIFTWNLPNH